MGPESRRKGLRGARRGEMWPRLPHLRFPGTWQTPARGRACKCSTELNGLCKGRGVLSSLSGERIAYRVGLWSGENGDLRGREDRRASRSSLQNFQTHHQERAASPGRAVLSLSSPHMTPKPCLHPPTDPPSCVWTSLTRLPGPAGAPQQPRFPLSLFPLLTWIGQDQMFSEAPSRVTGQGGRVPCATGTEHADLD